VKCSTWCFKDPIYLNFNTNPLLGSEEPHQKFELVKPRPEVGTDLTTMRWRMPSTHWHNQALFSIFPAVYVAKFSDRSLSVGVQASSPGRVAEAGDCTRLAFGRFRPRVSLPPPTSRCSLMVKAIHPRELQRPKPVRRESWMIGAA
jgi:hypothetical protein